MRVAHLEELLDSYSAQELEQLVLGGVLTLVGNARTRSSAGIDGYGRRMLQPLIFFQEADGAVTVYDLDASTITARLLIPRDDQNEPQAIHHIVIEVDPPKQSPSLTFTMVLSTVVHHSKPCNSWG